MISWTCGLGVCGSATWFTSWLSERSKRNPQCPRIIPVDLRWQKGAVTRAGGHVFSVPLTWSAPLHLHRGFNISGWMWCSAASLPLQHENRDAEVRVTSLAFVCVFVCVVDDTNESIIMWNESTLPHKGLTHHTEEVINARLGGCGATNCFHYNYTSDKYQLPAASGRVVKLLMFDSDV